MIYNKLLNVIKHFFKNIYWNNFILQVLFPSLNIYIQIVL